METVLDSASDGVGWGLWCGSRGWGSGRGSRWGIRNGTRGRAWSGGVRRLARG